MTINDVLKGNKDILYSPYALSKHINALENLRFKKAPEGEYSRLLLETSYHSNSDGLFEIISNIEKNGYYFKMSSRYDSGSAGFYDTEDVPVVEIYVDGEDCIRSIKRSLLWQLIVKFVNKDKS